MSLDSQITQSREPGARAGKVVPAYVGRMCRPGASAQMLVARNSVGDTVYLPKRSKIHSRFKLNLVTKEIHVSSHQPVAYWRRVANRTRTDGTGAFIYR